MNKMINRIGKRIQHYKTAIENRAFIDRRLLYAAWEYMHLERLFSHLQVDCVIDIGANEGQYALMLRRKAKYQGYIFSFEPDPIVAERLRKCAADDDRWFVEEVAISESDGTAVFNVMAHSEFSSLSTPRHEDVQLFRHMNRVENKILVRTERLETALSRIRLRYNYLRPFLKMDTQGFDVKIVNSSTEVMKYFVGLQSELSISRIYEDSVDFRDAISVYESHGFLLSAFVPNNSGHFPRLLEIDCIMIRSDLAAM